MHHRRNQERLIYSDYTRQLYRPSKLIPGKTVPAGEVMRCPSCSKQHERMNHGVAVVCKCGLGMEPRGNCLYIWPTDKFKVLKPGMGDLGPEHVPDRETSDEPQVH